MPRKEGTKAKVGRKPPRHAAHTPRNSWTAPAKLARRKRITEALAYREQGHPFPAIAKQMKISLSTAHAYVVEGLNADPVRERAGRYLALELTRLDASAGRALRQPRSTGDASRDERVGIATLSHQQSAAARALPGIWKIGGGAGVRVADGGADPGRICCSDRPRASQQTRRPRRRILGRSHYRRPSR